MVWVGGLDLDLSTWFLLRVSGKPPPNLQATKAHHQIGQADMSHGQRSSCGPWPPCGALAVIHLIVNAELPRAHGDKVAASRQIQQVALSRFAGCGPRFLLCSGPSLGWPLLAKGAPADNTTFLKTRNKRSIGCPVPVQGRALPPQDTKHGRTQEAKRVKGRISKQVATKQPTTQKQTMSPHIPSLLS